MVFVVQKGCLQVLKVFGGMVDPFAQANEIVLKVA
jgi:hypothetical protein